MSEHTQGPWDRHKTEVYFPNRLGGFSLRGCPDAEANAALVAAAPELLKALEKFIADSQSVNEEFNDLHEATEQARAAIAKARGEA